MSDALMLEVAQRPGWFVFGAVAVFEPSSGGWRGVVRRVGLLVGLERYDVLIVDSLWRGVLAFEVATMAEARRIAERHVPRKVQPNTD